MKSLKNGIVSDCSKKYKLFLKSGEVFLNKELTIRETAAATTGGQSFFSCSCKSKIPCQTSRCTRLKNKYCA